MEQVVYLKKISTTPTITTIKYSKADSNKNWLQSIQISDGGNTIMNVREIEYYPE